MHKPHRPGELAPGARIDWLRLEKRIRAALRQQYLFPARDPMDTLEAIDNALGEETGRGWELEERPRAYPPPPI